MNGVYLYFVNKHRSRWPLFGTLIWKRWGLGLSASNVQDDPWPTLSQISELVDKK